VGDTLSDKNVKLLVDTTDETEAEVQARTVRNTPGDVAS